MHTFLGETKGNSFSIPLEQLGAPGSQAFIEIVPIFVSPDDGKTAPKPAPLGPRVFELKAKLARSPTHLALNANFSPLDGSSHMTVAEEHHYIEIGDSSGILRIDKNAANELSMISGEMTARDASEAHRMFANRLSSFTDRISYLASIPIYVELIVVKDLATEIQTVFYVSPPRPCVINTGGEILQLELAPVYALYRESQNAYSPYYRVLCLFKIMEGLFLSLGPELRKRAKLASVILNTPKSIVPDHEDFPIGLRYLVGRPVKEVFDTFLQKQYRDAMAHFNLTGKAPLNVSDQLHWSRFTDVAFVANLCTRVLIARHEQSVQELTDATANANEGK